MDYHFHKLKQQQKDQRAEINHPGAWHKSSDRVQKGID